MKTRVINFIKEHSMLKQKDCVIVGLSGGADSVCLLSVLLELKCEMELKIVAVHVNHGIRGQEAQRDQKYVEELCKQKGILCDIYLKDVEWIAKKRKQSTEEAGRIVRKECFEESFRRHHAQKIALAHHKNDNAETFFLNLARGCGLKGMGGMKAVNGRYIRPLLCLERWEVESCLEEAGLPYCNDSTNAGDDYMRNRIRNHVIPYLENHVNAKVVAHMQETMEYLQEVQQYLESECRQWEKEAVVSKGKNRIILEKSFVRMPKALRPLLLRNVLVQLAEREKDIESIHIQMLQALFERQVGKQLHLPYEVTARRTYEGVEMRQGKTEPKEYSEVRAKCSDSTEQVGRYKIRYRYLHKMEEDFESEEKKYTKYFDCDIIKDGITFRTRKPGDYLTISTDGKKQKIKSFFINEKIPQDMRDEILLVADGSHILWIVGYRTNLFYKVTGNTKNIVEIQVDKGENYGREN